MHFGSIRRWARKYRNPSEQLGPNTVLARGDIIEVGGKEYVIQRGCLGSEFMDHVQAAKTVGDVLPTVLHFPPETKGDA